MCYCLPVILLSLSTVSVVSTLSLSRNVEFRSRKRMTGTAHKILYVHAKF